MSRIQFFYFAVELWGAFFSLLAFWAVFVTRKFDRDASRKLMLILFSSAFFLLSDSLAWFFRGDTSPAAFWIVRVTCFSNLLLSFITLATMGSYFAHIIYSETGKNQRVYKILNYTLLTVGSTFLVLSRFFNWIYSFDSQNNLRLEVLNKVPVYIFLMYMLLTMVVFVKHFRYLKKFESYSILTLVGILIVVMLLQALNVAIPFIDLSFVPIVTILVIAYEQKYTGYLLEQQNKLNESRIALFNRQIKPHFIFNSLSAIRALCRNSPEGVEAINDFSYFIRESIDMLNNDECISAEREFTTVEHYMNLITKRFDDGITVNYNIENTDFLIPPFSVQTLVENSVRHGIRKRDDRRGVITISSFRRGNNNVVEIVDDGVGFDPAEVDVYGDRSVGIKNTRERLSMMCSGKLEIESTVGKGTTARIIIPAI